MTLLGYAILPLILVGAQVAMTSRYGWWGLAWGTGAGIIVIFGGGAIVKEMTLLDYAIVLSLILVGAQAAMTRRYGWWGLAWGTGVGIIVIFWRWPHRSGLEAR